MGFQDAHRAAAACDVCGGIEPRRGATHDDNLASVPVLLELVLYVVHCFNFTLLEECAVARSTLLQIRTTA